MGVVITEDGPIRTLVVDRVAPRSSTDGYCISTSHLGTMMNEDQLIAAIRQRASNPTTRIDSAERWHRELGPPASADAIEAAEKDMGCHFHQLHRRLFREVGNGGFGPGYGLIGIPEGSLDVEERSMNELKQGLFLDHEKLQTSSMVPLCDWGCGIWSCVDCETGAILSISEFGLRDLEQGLQSWFEDWISGVNLWDRMVVVNELRMEYPRMRKWIVGQAVTEMRGKIWSSERRATRHT
jgi:hypothetical protein